MLDLTCIFLHNWHRFRNKVIPVQDSLYLAGHNGSGKSTILDAMQVVLLADLDLIKFNSSAQERSERTLDGFVRGKIFETRLLRPGGCVGYIALEFTDSRTQKKLTLGCCIEASEKLGRNGERAYFILQSALDPALFQEHNQYFTRSQLKALLQRRYGAGKGKYYDTVREYQTDMLDMLGLNRRFFDLFQRGLSFKSIRDIGSFVEQWLLPEHPLALESLQKVVSRLDDLQREAKIVEEKVAALDQIVARRTAYLRFQALQAHYELLHALLEQEAAVRSAQDLTERAGSLQERMRSGEVQRREIEAALRGARQGKLEKEKKLYGLDVVKRRDELQQQIQDKTRLANEIASRKRKLLLELDRACRSLATLLKTQLLQTEEEREVRVLLSLAQGLTQESELPEHLAQQAGIVNSILQEATSRVRLHRQLLEQERDGLNHRTRELEQEIRSLDRQGASIAYPDYVEFLRSRLERVIGRRPDILCERLEIPDERWQNAVEAMLGERRFTIIVPPLDYKAALAYIDQNRDEPGLHNASVLNLERALREQRPAYRSSLARQVQTDDRYLRAYIDSVLGTIITCLSAQELEHHQRSITPEVMYYSEWAVRVISPKRYTPWVIGQRAARSQIEVRQQELKQVRDRLVQLAALYQQVKEDEQRFHLEGDLVRVIHLHDEPLDDRFLRTEIAALKAERDALDLSAVDELKSEISRLESIITREEGTLFELNRTLGANGQELEQVNHEMLVARDTLQAREQRLAELVSIHPEEARNEAERLFHEQRSTGDLAVALANAQRSAKNFATQAGKALDEHRELALKYNVSYQFAGQPAFPQQTRYAEEMQRLRETALPSFQSDIDQTKQEAMQELREHVLHILRERIIFAERELQRMNDALKPLSFNGDRYRFRWEKADRKRDYYDLIMGSQVIGVTALRDSEFYLAHRETFDHFYEDIIRASMEGKRSERADLIDYRTYMEYDIEVLHGDGGVSRLSHIIGQTSGGETQTPFYLAIAASFVQLYRMGTEGQHIGRNARPCIRLAVFDEAFNAMDQKRIGATLDLFLKYGLQVVTATPLERCEYLVPKMCTNLVLTAVSDDVLVEEYRNYAARIERPVEELDEV